VPPNGGDDGMNTMRSSARRCAKLFDVASTVVVSSWSEGLQYLKNAKLYLIC
jgi:hypothetical protein